MNLPAPSQDALIHQQKLLRFLGAIMKAKGRITFAEYMAITLYAPGLGYYSAGAQKFGAMGDFVTAPMISPLFSQCIAKQCAQILSALQNPNACILELGAGTGEMALEAIKTLENLNALPHTYYILEVSGDLRARQQALIRKKGNDLFERFVWLDKLPEKPFDGIIVGNEVLDAMPVEIFKIGKDNDILQMYCDEAWQTHFYPASEQLTKAVQDLQNNLEYQFEEGYTSEINLGLPAWIKTLSDVLNRGAMLFIDYGFSQHEYYHPSRHMGTLMCHYRHFAHSDPMKLIGLQDITAHVDFTALAKAAMGASLNVAGFTNQGSFLIALNLLENSHLDAHEQIKLSQQIQKLTSPHEMGELFKTMALTKNIELPLQGFSLRDFRHRL